MDLKKLINMDMGEASQWLIDNQDKYDLVERGAQELEKAEQQLYGYYMAKSGERLDMVASGMGLTLDEYNALLNMEMINYLSESQKAEIRSAVE